MVMLSLVEQWLPTCSLPDPSWGMSHVAPQWLRLRAHRGTAARTVDAPRRCREARARPQRDGLRRASSMSPTAAALRTQAAADGVSRCRGPSQLLFAVPAAAIDKGSGLGASWTSGAAIRSALTFV